MFCLRKWLPCVVALAGAVVLGTAGPARADIELLLSVSDGSGDSISRTYDFTTNSFTGSASTTGSASGTFVAFTTPGQNVLELIGGQVGGYAVTVSTGVSNSPGTPALAFVNSTNNTVAGSGSGLTIETSGAGFTLPSSPPAPVLILSTDSSANTLGGNAATIVTYTGSAGTTLGGSELASASGSYSTPAAVGNGSGPALTQLFNATSYTLTDVLSIGPGTANYGGISGSVNVTTPAPAGVVLALTALPFLGIGTWLRRRKQGECARAAA